MTDTNPATEKRYPYSKIARHILIARILGTEHIASQDELRDKLAEKGILSTQSTVSRDLAEMGVTRTHTSEGKKRYILPSLAANTVLNGPENGGIERLTKLCETLIVVVENVSNFISIRTPAGAGQLLASALDNADLPEMVSCVGGNDTIHVMCRSPHSASALRDKLIALAEQDPQ
ncbi:MAG: hypothetical protein Q4A71_05950 [Actinomycetaceae bacterium]|nr:hypothetical protein [Actinomycetaceae bacterium]